MLSYSSVKSDGEVSPRCLGTADVQTCLADGSRNSPRRSSWALPCLYQELRAGGNKSKMQVPGNITSLPFPLSSTSG